MKQTILIFLITCCLSLQASEARSFIALIEQCVSINNAQALSALDDYKAAIEYYEVVCQKISEIDGWYYWSSEKKRLNEYYKQKGELKEQRLRAQHCRHRACQQIEAICKQVEKQERK